MSLNESLAIERQIEHGQTVAKHNEDCVVAALELVKKLNYVRACYEHDIQLYSIETAMDKLNDELEKLGYNPYNH